MLSRKSRTPDAFPFALKDSNEFDGIVWYADYLERVGRGNWLKGKYGADKVPRELFKTVINADITTEVLDRWYNRGGMGHVEKCVFLFFLEKGGK